MKLILPPPAITRRLHGPSLVPLALALVVGVALLTGLIGTWTITTAADLRSCPNGPPSLTALSLAGEDAHARSLLRAWEDGCQGDKTMASLHRAIDRDWWLIGAYTVTLPWWLVLGATFDRRPTRLAAARRLAALMPLAAAADVASSVLLDLWLDRQRGLLIEMATVAAWFKWSVVVPALAFATFYAGSLTIRLIRPTLGGASISRPGFWRWDDPVLPRPTPPAGTKRDPAHPELWAGHWCAPPLAGADGSTGPHGDNHYRRPDGTLWPGSDGRIGVALSGGGIRAAGYALGALQGLAENGYLSRVDHLSTVSGGGYVGGAFQLMAHLRDEAGDTGDPAPFGPDSPEVAELLRDPRYLWSSTLPPSGPDQGARFRGQLARSTREYVIALTTLLAGIVANLAVVAAVAYALSRGLGFAARMFLYADVAAPAVAAGEPVSVDDAGLGPAGIVGAVVAAAALAYALYVPAGRWAAGLCRGWPSLEEWTGRIGAAAVGGGFLLTVVVLSKPQLPSASTLRVVPVVVVVVLATLHVIVPKLIKPVLRLVPGTVLTIIAGWFAVRWYLQAFRGGFGEAQSIWPQTRWAVAGAAGLVAAVVFSAAARAIVAVVAYWRGRPSAQQGLLLRAGAAALGLPVAAVAWRAAGRFSPGWGVTTAGRIWLVVTGMLTVVYLVADQKLWSPHPFYKRRLAARFSLYRPQPGTAASIPWRIPTTLSEWAARVPGHPELLVVAAVYDSFQPRRGLAALPFTFSSTYVGGPDIGWMRTMDFEAALGRRNAGDGTLLGAMAISGAAVSPAIGSVDVGSAASLLALLNLRLGVWLPSPNYVSELTGRRPSLEGHHPQWVTTRRLNYLLRELTSRYDPDDRFVYVTDGGQFDNLGVYALLERRCSTILAFDASGDLKAAAPGSAPSCRTFDELRQLAEDRLGIRIVARGGDDGASSFGPVGRPGRTDEATARPAPRGWRHLAWWVPGRRERAAWVIPEAEGSIAYFDIRYPQLEGEKEASSGLLVLAKAVIADDTSPDIRRYAVSDAGRGFPADSTVHQFLSAERFGWYVQMGRDNAARAIMDPPPTVRAKPPAADELTTGAPLPTAG